jgi:hypothetical protein
MLFSGRWPAVREVGALSDLDNISVTVADVAARLAVLGDRLRDELRSSTFPYFIAGNAWCLGSSKESRARRASCDRRQQSLGSAPLTGLAPRSNSAGIQNVRLKRVDQCGNLHSTTSSSYLSGSRSVYPPPRRVTSLRGLEGSASILSRSRRIYTSIMRDSSIGLLNGHISASSRSRLSVRPA